MPDQTDRSQSTPDQWLRATAAAVGVDPDAASAALAERTAVPEEPLPREDADLDADQKQRALLAAVRVARQWLVVLGAPSSVWERLAPVLNALALRTVETVEEWEYGVMPAHTTAYAWPVFETVAKAEDWRASIADDPRFEGVRLGRRRPEVLAGPWEPVPATSGEEGAGV